MGNPLRDIEVSPLDDEVPEPRFVWAHRGASALAPENSMEAFELAVALGADGIELDVQLSADGVPVVIHDPHVFAGADGLSLHRPTGSPGASASRLAVGSSSFEELTSMPVISADGRATRLARLEEVLDALPDWMWLNVELKAGWRYEPRLAGVVTTCLRRRPDKVVVSSFDHLVLREVHEHSPELPLAALCDARLVDARAVLAPIPARMLNLRRAFVTEGDVLSLRRAGIGVSVYGGEILLDLAGLLAWPVAGVFLDDPRLARAGRATPP